MFDDRRDAGEKLARALEKCKDSGALVLAIPRGGAAVGLQVAKYLNADFSLLISRKLPYPFDPEAGFGAIAEDGSTVFVEGALASLPQEFVDQVAEEQKREIVRRVKALRGSGPLPEIKGRTVILIDDGIAMGSTMRAAVKMCRNRGAKKIIVAAPISSIEAEKEFSHLADEAVILDKPEFFQAVAEGYRDWYDLNDKEVLGIMLEWEDFLRKKRKDN